MTTTTPTHASTTTGSRLRRVGVLVVVTLVLGLVAAAYLDPQLAVELENLVWACVG